MERRFRDHAIVLRYYPLGEADRIVVLYTRTRGLIRAVAKGVRRQRSRFGSRLEPFTLTEIECYRGRSLYTVTNAFHATPYGDQIAADYERFTAASAVVEAVEQLAGEEECIIEHFFDLLSGVIDALATGHREPRQMLDTFLLRALALAGWAITVKTCAVCGKPGQYIYFSPALGGTVCSEHRPPHCDSTLPQVAPYLEALVTGQWSTVDALSGQEDDGHKIEYEAHRIITTHLQWHTERSFAAMRTLNNNI